MGTFSLWSPYTRYVQGGMNDVSHAHGAHTMLAAGPPRIANIGGAAGVSANVSAATDPQGNGGSSANQIVYPMGLVQQFNLSHSRQFNRVFELGSERSYFISGRTVGQINLGRVYYHGPSLLRTLYAYFADGTGPAGQTFPSLWPNAGQAAMGNPHDVVIPPGYENIFLNLASDLFSQYVGLMMYMRDVNEQALGAGYFEACNVPNHNIQTDANSVMFQESCMVQFERMVPIYMANTVELISGTNTTGAATNETYPGYPEI